MATTRNVEAETSTATTRDVEVDRDTEFVFRLDWDHDADHGVYRIGREDRELKYAGPS